MGKLLAGFLAIALLSNVAEAQIPQRTPPLRTPPSPAAAAAAPTQAPSVVMGNSKWLGYPFSPMCVLTDAATVTIDLNTCVTAPETSPNPSGVQSYAWTLTGPGHKLLIPQNMPPTGVVWFEVRITHSSAGNDGPLLGAGFVLPKEALNSNGQPVWSPTGIDRLQCESVDAATADCITLLAMTPVGGSTPPSSSYSVAAHALGPMTPCNGVSSCSFNLTVTSGHLLIVGSYVTGVTIAGVSGAANLIGACKVATGTHGSRAGVDTAIYLCPITGTGNATITAQYSGSGAWGQLALVDLAGASTTPDLGVGNFAGATSGQPSVTTTGSVNAGGFVFGWAGGSGVPTGAGGGGTLLDASSQGYGSLYLKPAASGNATASFTGMSPPWDMSVVAIQ